MGTNLEPHGCATSVESAKNCTHQNKAINSIAYVNVFLFYVISKKLGGSEKSLSLPRTLNFFVRIKYVDLHHM